MKVKDPSIVVSLLRFVGGKHVMKALTLLIALFAAGTAAAQTPQTENAPGTAASAAQRYEQIAQKQLPGYRVARPADFTISKWYRNHISAKGWKKVLPYQPPVSGDIDGDGHGDFALVMKTRHSNAPRSFYLVACLWRQGNDYECKPVDHALPGRAFVGTSIGIGSLTPDSGCLINQKTWWSGPALLVEPYLANIVTGYTYDKSTGKFHVCVMGD